MEGSERIGKVHMSKFEMKQIDNGVSNFECVWFSDGGIHSVYGPDHSNTELGIYRQSSIKNTC